MKIVNKRKLGKSKKDYLRRRSTKRALYTDNLLLVLVAR